MNKSGNRQEIKTLARSANASQMACPDNVAIAKHIHSASWYASYSLSFNDARVSRSMSEVICWSVPGPVAALPDVEGCAGSSPLASLESDIDASMCLWSVGMNYECTNGHARSADAPLHREHKPCCRQAEATQEKRSIVDMAALRSEGCKNAHFYC